MTNLERPQEELRKILKVLKIGPLAWLVTIHSRKHKVLTPVVWPVFYYHYQSPGGSLTPEPVEIPFSSSHSPLSNSHSTKQLHLPHTLWHQSAFALPDSRRWFPDDGLCACMSSYLQDAGLVNVHTRQSMQLESNHLKSHLHKELSKQPTT